MTLENRLNITDSADLAREERISKKKAAQLFDNKLLDSFTAGKFDTLQAINKYIFELVLSDGRKSCRCADMKGVKQFSVK